MKCNVCKAEIGNKSRCPYCGASQKTIPMAINKQSVEMAKAASASKVFEENVKGTLEIFATQLSSLGTGFLINARGYAITNAHVVSNDDMVDQCLEIKVANRKVNAKVISIASALSEDLALIKLDMLPVGARPLKLGNSDKIKTGDISYIIGNSLGDGICITQGIISDKCREFCGRDRIMTDTAMNPGNSGGPLLNEQGNVIGVCVEARITNQYIKNAPIPTDGMKYCIPINIVKKFLKTCNVNYEE